MLTTCPRAKLLRIMCLLQKKNKQDITRNIGRYLECYNSIHISINVCMYDFVDNLFVVTILALIITISGLVSVRVIIQFCSQILWD